ncbi:D-tagatose-1,6-bisphosphate aldolase subunit isoform X1 [Tasmannia lanceolata]|uniref:D-tagatose-1,6-bisphosphate aldolase subunit isoform X1 n=1 Tax=Tasmannia lanceolata TaxID=3420 RepID=UPI004063266B
MAESTVASLCYYPSFPSFTTSSSSSSRSKRNPNLSFSSPRPFSRLVRTSAKDSDGSDFSGEDPFGFFPWDYSSNSQPSGAIQWVPGDRVTIFTADGLLQIGGSLVPRRIPTSDKQGKGKASQRVQRFQERDYMDPDQGLCLGALFDIAATNVRNSFLCGDISRLCRHFGGMTKKIYSQGLDMGRRLCIFGFCRSIEMLSDVVEDTVIEHGGEVVAAEKASDGGLQEKLTMTLAVPLLWGVPPASDTLHFAVRSGGGIVEKVYWQWDFL